MVTSLNKLTVTINIENLSVNELFNLFVDLNNKIRNTEEEILYKALDLEIIERLKI